MQVGHRDNMIGPDRSVGVRRRAAAQVAVSIEVMIGLGIPILPSTRCTAVSGTTGPTGPAESAPALRSRAFVHFFHRQRLHAAQRRRNIELHYRHDAKILGAHNGL